MTYYYWNKSQPGGTASDELIVTYPDNKLYYLDANKNPVNIGTLEGPANLLAFGDYALILDGSYMKIWDRSVPVLKLAYDDGTGTTGYQHDQTDLTPDTSISLYSGANTKAGISFTTQMWDQNYTIAITQVDVYLNIYGSPTGNIGCELYDSDETLIATSDTTYSAADLTTTAELLSFSFSSGDMDTSTEYWAVITYSGGDASNYVKVNYDAVGSGGNGKVYDGSWSNSSTKEGVMAVKPGKPPKASFGVIKDNRAFVGGDQNNPGWMWYCNVADPFDWSTENGGGYVGAIDSNASNFPLGAIALLYGSLYVFGTKSQPYICKLLGISPSDFELLAIFQKVYGTSRTTLDIGNDIWFGNDGGIDSLTGVQEYGDLRRFSNANSIQNIFNSYWDDSEVIAGYNPIGGQYIIKLPGYPKCLVCHTKNPLRTESGKIRYPWTEYAFIQNVLTSATYQWTASGSGSNEYYLEISGGGDPSVEEPEALMMDDSVLDEGTIGNLSDHEWAYGDNDSLGYSTVYLRDNSGDPDSSGVSVKTLLIPTSFAYFQNVFFIGCHDGYIYQLDPSVLEDNSNGVNYLLAGKLNETIFSEINLDRYHIICDSDGTGSNLNLQFTNSDVDIDELHSETMDVDIDVTIDSRTDGDINWNTLKFQPWLREISPNGSHLRIHQILLDSIELSK